MATSALPSIGFSGAGFLGCYHVGVAACLQRHGWLGLDYSANRRTTTIQPTTIKPLVPLLTGVSAGSMIAAATAAGVAPEPDGMDVVLTAARRTRELSKKSQLPTFDALTPGYSLIDAVEGTFREAIVKALGGSLPSQSQQQNRDYDYTLESLYDIDPQLFQRRFPMGSLRIGLTDKRALLSSFPPPSPLSSVPTAYRYVDSYRNVEDVVAACMLSSYIPGVTGPLLGDNISDKLLEAFNIGGSEKDEEAGNDAMKRAGRQLREMTRLGLVKDGKTGLPSAQSETETGIERSSQDEEDDSTQYWDGGIADLFPTFDDNTTIVSPISGMYSNPTICPSMQQPNEVENNSSVSYLLRSYVPSLPATFRHCSKSSLGLNMENARAVKDMILSSDDEQLYQRFKEGYDDTTRFLNERGLTRVFRG
mmetsp:Transcript_659/g.1594  ORF Transcript_659/g.1594 Transcript_659/m.1594 type:complete len:421 (-) Transcript_659:1187-2449(-)